MTTKRWHIDKCFFREKVSFVIINVKPDFWNERRWYSSLIPSCCCCWLAALYFFDMAEIELFRHFLLPWWDPFCSHSYKYFPKCDTVLTTFFIILIPLRKSKNFPKSINESSIFYVTNAFSKLKMHILDKKLMHCVFFFKLERDCE